MHKDLQSIKHINSMHILSRLVSINEIKSVKSHIHCLSLASTGGRYLTIPEVGNKRTGRGARLVLPLTPPWNDGNLCLSFRHKLAGHHVGMLQVFVKKGKQYSPAVWGRTGGNGWRHTQITLWGTGLESVSITTDMSERLSHML